MPVGLRFNEIVNKFNGMSLGEKRGQRLQSLHSSYVQKTISLSWSRVIRPPYTKHIHLSTWARGE